MSVDGMKYCQRKSRHGLRRSHIQSAGGRTTDSHALSPVSTSQSPVYTHSARIQPHIHPHSSHSPQLTQLPPHTLAACADACSLSDCPACATIGKLRTVDGRARGLYVGFEAQHTGMIQHKKNR